MVYDILFGDGCPNRVEFRLFGQRKVYIVPASTFRRWCRKHRIYPTRGPV